MKDVSEKVLISYSWTNSTHKNLVEQIAISLRNEGINASFDQWDLSPGDDIYSYMESFVNDQKVTNVLLICDREYARKADQGIGGSGIEATNIAQELYGKKKQSRFIPIVTELNDDGSPCLPLFLKRRLYLDLTTRSNFANVIIQIRNTILGTEGRIDKGSFTKILPVPEFEDASIAIKHSNEIFIDRDRFPGERVQSAGYRRWLEEVSPHPLTIAALEISEDAILPYFPIAEPNPAIGWRGILVHLTHPEISLTQLRAMLLANIGIGTLRILMPPIFELSMLDEFNTFLKRVKWELEEEGNEGIVMPPVGAAIEVPAMLYEIEAISKSVDFFSINSDSLTKYLLALDPNNRLAAEYYSEFNPGVINALNTLAQQIASTGKPASIHGTFCESIGGIIQLWAMGYTTILTRKKGRQHDLKSFKFNQCLSLLEGTKKSRSSTEVRRIIQEFLLMNEKERYPSR